MTGDLVPTLDVWAERKNRLEVILSFAQGASRSVRCLGDDAWFELLGRQWQGIPDAEAHIPELLASPFYAIACKAYRDPPAGLRPQQVRQRWIRCGHHRQAFMSEAGESSAYNALPSKVALYRACFENQRENGLVWHLTEAQALAAFDASAGDMPVLQTAQAINADIAAVKIRRGVHEDIAWAPEIIHVEDIAV